jgi:hypothetical protein
MRAVVRPLIVLALGACGVPKDRAERAQVAAARNVLSSMSVDSACRCRIVLNKAMALGDDNDDVALRTNTVLSRDAAGRYLAAATHSQSSIAVFAPNGDELTSFGRQGEGPGEFGRIRYVRATPGDSILVMDRSKLALFTPSGLPVRERALPSGVAAFRFAVLQSGHVVVNNYFPTHRSLILLNRTFDALRELGTTTPANSRNDSDAIQYHVVGLDSGRFAAVRQNYRYGIEIYDTTGALVRSFDKIPSWYVPWTEAEKLARGYQTHAYPVIQGIHAKGQQLWVAARVPDPLWKDPDPPSRAADRTRETSVKPVPIDEYDRRYDTVIEVLNISTGKVLVSQRFDALVSHFTEGGFLYSLREAPSLLLRIDIWRPEIVQQP